MEARLKRGSDKGIFLIGLGILALTGWWWPGIMVVVGLSLAIKQTAKGRPVRGLGLLALMVAIPVLTYSGLLVSWSILGPLVLIALGLGYLVGWRK